MWVPATATTSGSLLFSDPNNNTIYRWSAEGQVSVFRTKSGYSGFNVGEYHQPGSNGLTLDSKGRLTINPHGNRRVIRVEPRGNITVLADRYEDKRLNSPNDLVYRSDGALYFTYPPFGLPKVYDDPRKEVPYSGAYCVKDGQVNLVSTDLDAPNGLAFSPDEKFLYVNNWNDKKKVILRYDVKPDCTLTNSTLFFDMTNAPGNDALDGLKVDQQGNVYSAGPGGLWIMSPGGKQLGLIKGPEDPHNMAWGDDDGKTMHITALTGALSHTAEHSRSLSVAHHTDSLSASIFNSGIFSDWTDFLIASIARGLVNPRRHARPMRRPGTGFINVSVTKRLLSYFFVSALQGNTVMPSPDATIWRIVSREFPCTPSASDRLSSGQESKIC